MQCSICKNVYHDFKTYFVHLCYYHNITDYFKCPYENCERVYDTKSSLKKHVCANHDIQNNVNVVLPEIKQSETGTTTRLGNVGLSDVSTATVHSDDDHSNDTSLENFKIQLNKSILSFLSQLYSISNLPRTVIQTIFKLVSDLFTSEPINILKNTMNSISEECSSMLSLLQSSLENLGTDYKRMECFKKLHTYTQPVPKTVGVSEDTKSVQGSVEMTLKNRCSYMIPLRESLKSFLEIPNVLTDILNYEKEISKDNVTLRNLVNGNRWQEVRKSFDKDDNVLPLTIYYDDFESGNPLGSHAGNQKMGVVYATISTIPPKFSSRLENILLVLVFYSIDKTTFGNESIFGPLITELKFLEQEGIPIVSKGHLTIFKFCLANMSGDNLGLHSMLGFHESFSSNHFCRFCVTPKNLTRTDTKERFENVRNAIDYTKHCQEKIGIKEECVWHHLTFHCYKNLTCDVMHDLCEGVHRYDMCLIIQKLLDGNFFSLKTLNSRIKFFTYLRTEKNCPPSVTKQHLINGQLCLSASEMLCLVRNFRFIIGDLVEKNDPSWLHYLCLLEITDILTSQVFTAELIAYLSNLIEIYLENLQKIFESSLKPKHHFLVHYARVIEQIGPPVLVSAFKFESKHKELKAIAQSISCRRNLPLTLSTRHQLNSSHRLIARKGFTDCISNGKVIHVIHYPMELNEAEYICVEYFEINGVKYSNKNVLLYKYDINFPVFYKIDQVFLKETDNSIVSFLCTVLETVGYSSHYLAFVVETTTQSKLICLEDCDSKSPTLIRKLNDSFYVDLKS